MNLLVEIFLGKCKKFFQDGLFLFFAFGLKSGQSFLFVCLFVSLFFAFIFLFFRLGSGKCARFCFFFLENIRTFSEGAKSCDNRSNQTSFYDIRNF